MLQFRFIIIGFPKLENRNGHAPYPYDFNLLDPKQAGQNTPSIIFVKIFISESQPFFLPTYIYTHSHSIIQLIVEQMKSFKFKLALILVIIMQLSSLSQSVAVDSWVPFADYSGYLPSYIYNFELKANDNLTATLNWIRPATSPSLNLNIYLLKSGENLLDRTSTFILASKKSTTEKPKILTYKATQNGLYHLRVDFENQANIVPYDLKIQINNIVKDTVYKTTIRPALGYSLKQFPSSVAGCKVRVTYEGPLAQIQLYKPTMTTITETSATTYRNKDLVSPKSFQFTLAQTGTWTIVVSHGLAFNSKILIPFKLVIQTLASNQCTNYCTAKSDTVAEVIGYTNKCVCKTGYKWNDGTQQCEAICQPYQSYNSYFNKCQCLSPWTYDANNVCECPTPFRIIDGQCRCPDFSTYDGVSQCVCDDINSDFDANGQCACLDTVHANFQSGICSCNSEHADFVDKMCTCPVNSEYNSTDSCGICVCTDENAQFTDGVCACVDTVHTTYTGGVCTCIDDQHADFVDKMCTCPINSEYSAEDSSGVCTCTDENADFNANGACACVDTVHTTYTDGVCSCIDDQHADFVDKMCTCPINSEYSAEDSSGVCTCTDENADFNANGACACVDTVHTTYTDGVCSCIDDQHADFVDKMCTCPINSEYSAEDSSGVCTCTDENADFNANGACACVDTVHTTYTGGVCTCIDDQHADFVDKMCTCPINSEYSAEDSSGVCTCTDENADFNANGACACVDTVHTTYTDGVCSCIDDQHADFVDKMCTCPINSEYSAEDSSGVCECIDKSDFVNNVCTCPDVSKLVNGVCTCPDSRSWLQSNLCYWPCILANRTIRQFYQGVKCKCLYGHEFRLAMGGCVQICGNGIKTQSEQCDDGNFVTTDSCTNGCKIRIPV